MINKNWSLLDDQLAESGLEMNIIGAVLGIGASLIGSAASSSAAKGQERAAKKQAEQQYKYDKKKYKMSKERLEADRDFTLEGIQINQRNEKTVADLKDQVALDNYESQIKQRELRIKQNTKQFAKSSELYSQQRTFNDYASRSAVRGEQQRFNEQLKAAAFENQDLIIQSLQERGAIQARGQSGNSIGRLATNAVGALGRNQAIIQEQILGGRRARDQGIDKVNSQKLGADIQAFANLMIPAEDPLMPVAPRQTPLSEYQLPRELQDFDFGPEPMKGVVATGGASAAWMNGLASALPSIAGLFQSSGPSMSYGGGGFGGGGFGGGTNLGIASGGGFGSSFFGL